MSFKDSKHVVEPASIVMDDDGTLSYYFSDALECSDQKALHRWAEELIGGSDSEVNLSIHIDLPKMIHDLLTYGYGYEKDGGGFMVNAKHRNALMAVRKQLIDSLALLDSVEYEDQENAVH